VSAIAAAKLLPGGQRRIDHQRRVAAGTDHRAVGEPLDPVPREPPLLLDVGDADGAVDAYGLVLGWIEVERHR
jgi:hypothetical protein